MTAIVLCGLLALQMILISGCTAKRTAVETMLQELNSSLQSVQQQSVDASEASIQASQAEAASIQASQAEAASIQASQAEAASIQASQAEAASIQASQAEAASIQASQAEAASIQASQAEAASIQASQAEAASIQASQAEAASIQASQEQAAQGVTSQPPEGHEGPWVGGRTVYLTFDDGPSYLTPQVLDILDRYQIKATFFVTYTDKPEIVPYYSEIVRRGHTIGIHTASHEYEQIYSSMDAFVADFDKIYNYVRDLTGVSCQLYRFPGGSTTGLNLGIREQVKAWLQQRGIIYHDWNVVNGDGATVTADEAYHNVVDNIVQRTHPIVLMHDGVKKETTVEALPRIIETLQSWGFTFAPLDPSVEPIHHGINW